MHAGTKGRDCVIAAGFFSNKLRQTDKMAGLFFVKIDNQEQAIAASNFQDFNHDFLTLFLTEKQAEKKRELESISMNYLEKLMKPDELHGHEAIGKTLLDHLDPWGSLGL